MRHCQYYPLNYALHRDLSHIIGYLGNVTAVCVTSPAEN